MSSLPLSNFPVMDDEAAAPEATSDKMINVLDVRFEGRRGATFRNDLSESRRNNAIRYSKRRYSKRRFAEINSVNFPENASIRTASRSISFICSNEKSAQRVAAIKSKDRGEGATVNLCAQAWFASD